MLKSSENRGLSGNAPRKAGSSTHIRTPSTSSEQQLNQSAFDDYSTWNDILLVFPHWSKVHGIDSAIKDAYNDRK
jgi:hypothetical protein